MSENKFFKIIKTTPNQVMFILHSISNPSLNKLVRLTDRIPEQTVPVDWALDLFLNEENYQLFKKGCITVNDVEALKAAAIEAGVYFGDELDFTPAKVNDTKQILETVKTGNRSKILKAIEQYGEDKVKTVVMSNAKDLTSGVIQMLEGIFKIQLTMDIE